MSKDNDVINAALWCRNKRLQIEAEILEMRSRYVPISEARFKELMAEAFDARIKLEFDKIAADPDAITNPFILKRKLVLGVEAIEANLAKDMTDALEREIGPHPAIDRLQAEAVDADG